MKISRFLSLAIGVCLLVLMASIVFATEKTKAEPAEMEPQLVAKIVDVQYAEEEIKPPTLVVTATGEVPTSGYHDPKLLRATYLAAPADGIQDYFLIATPPSEVASQVTSTVTASDRWTGFTAKAPWIKGIRVHGAGDGVMVKMFSTTVPDETDRSERRFDGVSKDGQLQSALDEALRQLGQALGDGGVADAMATWTITGVTGQRGGIVPFNTVKVTITATRTPPWSKKASSNQ
jgi:hypothetical protein